MKNDIICPWCKDPKSPGNILTDEGILFCGRCKEYFEWVIHTEVKYETRKIRYVREDRPKKIWEVHIEGNHNSND